MTVDFGAREATYARVVPVEGQWWKVFELVVGEADLGGRPVVELGCGPGPLSEHDELSREAALDRIHRLHISTFDLLDEDEIRAGTALAERELPERVAYHQEWVIAVAAKK